MYALILTQCGCCTTFDDSGGRWRVGGGKNVPLKLQLQMARMKAKPLRRTLIEIGVENTLKEIEEKVDD